MPCRLDKFYTNRIIARQCKIALLDLIDPPQHVLEPAVGAGSWIEPGDLVVGFDAEPEFPGALAIDSLTPHLERIMRGAGLDEFLSLGNPPFGRKSQTAIAFVNQFLHVGHIVAFILPIAFRKWSVQSRIRPKAKLILDLDVPECAFELPDDTPYGIRTCFQIWTVRPSDRALAERRLKSKPPVAHGDFMMKRHNCTAVTRPYLTEDWDLAVPAQGFHDYSFGVRRGGVCEPKTQWMLFFADNPGVLDRINRIDFGRLSRKNMLTPGFGKADVVEAYAALVASDADPGHER